VIHGICLFVFTDQICMKVLPEICIFGQRKKTLNFGSHPLHENFINDLWKKEVLTEFCKLSRSRLAPPWRGGVCDFRVLFFVFSVLFIVLFCFILRLPRKVTVTASGRSYRLLSVKQT